MYKKIPVIITLFLAPGSYPLGNTISLKPSTASPAFFNILSSSGTEIKKKKVEFNAISETVYSYVHVNVHIIHVHNITSNGK